MKKILGISKGIRISEFPLLCIWQFDCSVHIIRGPCVSTGVLRIYFLLASFIVFGLLLSLFLKVNILYFRLCNVNFDLPLSWIHIITEYFLFLISFMIEMIFWNVIFRNSHLIFHCFLHSVLKRLTNNHW